MKTNKFTILIDAQDCYLYYGYYFFVLNSGELGVISVERLLNLISQKYGFDKSFFQLIFGRSDFTLNSQAELIFKIIKLKKAFQKLWDTFQDDEIINITICSQDLEIVSELPTLPVLDVRIYGMQIFLGTVEGIYQMELDIDKNMKIHKKIPRKRFDVKVSRINAKGGKILISCNKEGLFDGTFLNDKNKLIFNESPISSKSTRTNWTGFDLINYKQPNNFECFINSTEKADGKFYHSSKNDTIERKAITKIGVKKITQDKLLENSNFLNEDIIYCFNSETIGYFILADGRFLYKNLFHKDEYQIYFSKKDHLLPKLSHETNCYRKPISSNIIYKGCVIEYSDKVVIIKNNKLSEIENKPVITLRTYPKSFRYKSLITIVKDKEITVHSVYPYNV